MKSHFSTHLFLALLLIPLVALLGTRCLENDGHEGRRKSVGAMVGMTDKENREVEEGKAAENEVKRTFIRKINNVMKEKEEYDIMRDGEDKEAKDEGERLHDADKKKRMKKKRLVKEADNQAKNGGNKNTKSKNSVKVRKIKPKKVKEDSMKKKKKRITKKRNKTAVNNEKGLYKTRETKEDNKANDNKIIRTKKGKNRKKGNNEDNETKRNTSKNIKSITTSKKHPVFSFSNYVLAECGQTYKLSAGKYFLFTTDGGQLSRNCRAIFLSPPGSNIKLSCPVFSLRMKKCKKESLLLIENEKVKWLFCKTDVVDIETVGSHLQVHHKRKRLPRKKCPGAFLCEVSLGSKHGMVTMKPPPEPVPITHPQPTYTVPPVTVPATTGPHPGSPSTTMTTSTSTTTTTTVPTTSTTTTVPTTSPTTTATTTTTTTESATSTVPVTTEAATSTPSSTTTSTPTTTTMTTMTTTKTTTDSITTTTTTTTKSTYQPIYTEDSYISTTRLTSPPSTPTEPTTTKKPVITYPAPPLTTKPSPVVPQPAANRPFCYNCSPTDITITRIVGGSDAGKGEFPFQAHLYIENRTMCTGSLITRNMVLTAAHCYAFGFRETRVTLGEYNLKVNEDYSQVVNAKRVITHPDFNRKNMDNDIALLELERPVSITHYVSLVCLATTTDYFKSNVAVTAGWGHTKYGGYVSNILQKVALDIITNEECEEMYADRGYEITENMMCTYTTEKDACQGDSGGPLLRKVIDGKWVLEGITSFGYQCAHKNSPGVFTRAANYKDWIFKSIGSVKC